MSCSGRRNKIHQDLDRVTVLAQRVADVMNSEQKIYKTICDGVEIFKFSDRWPGEAVKVVRPNKQHTGDGVLRSSENQKSTVAKSGKRKAAKRSKSK